MAEQPVFLSNEDVVRFLSYDELIPRLEEVLGKFSRGDSSEVVQPVRSVIPIHNHNGYEDGAEHPDSQSLYTRLIINTDFLLTGSWG